MSLDPAAGRRDDGQGAESRNAAFIPLTEIQASANTGARFRAAQAARAALNPCCLSQVGLKIAAGTYGQVFRCHCRGYEAVLKVRLRPKAPSLICSRNEW